MQVSTETPPYQCPWCAYTHAGRKHVMTHMESVHHDRWCALALVPPIAGGEPL
jgi:hypothetical protein